MSDGQLKDYFVEKLTGRDIFLRAATEVLELKKTKYQNLALIKTELLGRVLILDNVCQLSEADEFIYHELLVQVPAILHATPQKVLILGGGDGCALREILKWKSIEQAVLVDIDPDVVNCARKHLGDLNQDALNHPKAQVVIEDAFNFVQQTQTKWDLIICDLSDPVEDGPSMRLFTQEFFQDLKKILTPQGILSVQSGPAAPPEHFYFTRVANTLKQVFPYFKACFSFCQSYLTPLGFSLVRQIPFPELTVNSIDKIIYANLQEPLRYLDGVTTLASLTIPKFLQTALDQETVIYNQKNKPLWF